jgi:hypothetical protein
VPRDYFAAELPSDPTLPLWLRALQLAYPDATVIGGPPAQLVIAGQTLPAEGPTDRPPMEVLRAPTMGDQFAWVYPLTRDLEARRAAFADPGRARHIGLFEALYGNDPDNVTATLTRVQAGPSAAFRVTQRQGVACQLQGAIGAMSPDWARLATFFNPVGGGFNWRVIAGTNRLSAHSFGIAVDINPQLGGYWRWSGALVGQVGQFDNKVPWSLTEAMERHGFIWGGKWHHYDGMHFEYRPEIILYSRLVAQAQSNP